MLWPKIENKNIPLIKSLVKSTLYAHLWMLSKQQLNYERKMGRNGPKWGWQAEWSNPGVTYFPLIIVQLLSPLT